MPSLQELIEKAQQGDEAALETLVLLFEPLIHRCARQAVVGEREDMEQDLNAKLIVLIRRYRNDSVQRG
jgi:DNA-directed RNA polymerase specialized sigma subunit